MRGMFSAPITKFGKFNLSFNFLFIFVRIIIHTLAFGAAKPHKSFRCFYFSHNFEPAGRIELPLFPLPRECFTTKLRWRQYNTY